MEDMMQGPFYQNFLKTLDEAATLINCDPNVLTRLKRPRRVLSFSIPVRMDDYRVEVFTGYRVQHNMALGPFKGGIRYHQNVDASEVAALAALMTMKNSLLGLPYGGGKGGVRVDPTKLSRTEKQNLTRRFTTELTPFIGPTKDIPAPDVGTDGQTMAWMMDTYSQQEGFTQPGVVTGKPVEIGGSLGRISSTGHGVIYCADQLCQKIGWKMNEVSIAIQGFGNVGRHAALKANEFGCKIVALSDVSGGIYNEKGLNVQDIVKWIDQNKVLKGYPEAQAITNEELLTLKVDILSPCALENAITDKNMTKVQAKAIVEGANGPLSSEASKYLHDKGILIVPDILANGGGVVVSYFEWVQDIQQFFWDEEEVEKNLKRILTKAFQQVWDLSQEKKISMRTAAMAHATRRLERAMLLRGLYPR